MIKIHKSKVGFTLIEMVLVIAIILILSSVLIIGVGTYLDKAKSAAEKVSAENESFSSNNDQINSKFVDLGY